MLKNKESVVEHLNLSNKGIVSVLNPVEDLLWKKNSNSNSWFAIGHFEAEGHVLNFMYHLMIYPLPTGSVMNACFSVTDETTKTYYGEDHFYSFDEIEILEDKFYIKVPNGAMSGDLETMKLEARMANASLDITMKPVGNIIYNGGSGIFSLLGIKVHQYSIPNLQTEGTIKIDDKSYSISGKSWFDRQWQQTTKSMAASVGKFRWTWMDLNLDSGEYISLWSVVNLETNVENSWATVLHTDGSQTVTTMESLTENQFDYWKSPVSKQNYPTKWNVKLPEIDAYFEITASQKEQEIVSQFINKYEAASKVEGTYKGNPVSGYCYVELVGLFD